MQQTNYVIARNSRGLPIIVPLSAVKAELPPPSIIPTKDIIAVDDDGVMPVVQYEKNGEGLFRMQLCLERSFKMRKL